MKKKYPDPYKYQLKNPSRYSGNPNEVWIRSSWEKKFMIWCDTSPFVVKWSSEELALPYISPIDNKEHRYFPDAIVTFTNKKTYMIEIKPISQALPPKGNKNSKRYITEATTFLINQAKWDVAKRYCKARNWEFKILDAYHLGINQ